MTVALTQSMPAKTAQLLGDIDVYPVITNLATPVSACKKAET
jgi:hypothetical protein